MNSNTTQTAANTAGQQQLAIKRIISWLDGTESVSYLAEGKYGELMLSADEVRLYPHLLATMTRAEAEAWIEEANSSSYCLEHGQAGRPVYVIIPAGAIA